MSGLLLLALCCVLAWICRADLTRLRRGLRRTPCRWETATWDEGQHVHILPLRDGQDHTEADDGDCICAPSIEPVERRDGSYGWLIVHHTSRESTRR